MRDKDPYIVVCLPNMGYFTCETTKSLALMFSYNGQVSIPGVRSFKTGLLTVQGAMPFQARHILVKKACQDPKVTHVLFIDSDMEFPSSTAVRLLNYDKDIIGCNCTTRVEPILPVAFDFEGNRINSFERSGIEKVRQVGLAVALLRVDMLRKLRPPLFFEEWVPEIGNYAGEDVYFCQAAQAAGYDVWIDHDLSKTIMHYGVKGWGYKDVKPENVAKAHEPLRLVKQGAAL